VVVPLLQADNEQVTRLGISRPYLSLQALICAGSQRERRYYFICFFYFTLIFNNSTFRYILCAKIRKSLKKSVSLIFRLLL